MDSSKTKWQNILPALLDLEQGNPSQSKIKPLDHSIESIKSISYTVEESQSQSIQDKKPKYEKISWFHHFSILSGPINACFHAAAFCLVPAHNVFKEPEYWYEFQLAVMLLLGCCYVDGILIAAELLANFTFEKRWTSYFLLISMAMVLYIGSVMAYYFVWTDVLGYTLPMAFSMYLPANFAFTAMNTAIWFR